MRLRSTMAFSSWELSRTVALRTLTVPRSVTSVLHVHSAYMLPGGEATCVLLSQAAHYVSSMLQSCTNNSVCSAGACKRSSRVSAKPERGVILTTTHIVGKAYHLQRADQHTRSVLVGTVHLSSMLPCSQLRSGEIRYVLRGSGWRNCCLLTGEFSQRTSVCSTSTKYEMFCATAFTLTAVHLNPG